MAGSASRVQAFLKGVAETVAAPARAEYAMYEQEYVGLGPRSTGPTGSAGSAGPTASTESAGGSIPNHERGFLGQRLRKAHYNFDAKLLSEYFEVERVSGGYVVVYLPGAPNPWSGSVAYLTEDRVEPLDLAPQDAIKNIRVLGRGSAKFASARAAAGG